MIRMREVVNSATVLWLMLAAIGSAKAAEPMFTQVEVFKAGEEGYHTFRIPSLIITKKGTVLAFSEGRRNSQSDTGDINTVLKRSFDRGRTWTKLQMVAEQAGNTIGNPCPVVDRDSGTIWLLLTGNPGDLTENQINEGKVEGTRTVWLTRSTDDGATWSQPREITRSVKRPEWTWYATGPGNGIQLRSGRLVIPCDHRRKGSKGYVSHVIYGDDRGKTWRIGGSTGEQTNECQVVELEDGSLLLNMRSYHGANRRAIARSYDGGLTWADAKLDQALIEPVCQASFIRFTRRPQFSKSRVLFANPADTTRVKLTVRISYDEAETWPVAKVINDGPSAYSSLAVLPDMTIGCLYERGIQNPYEKITFARFDIDWLTDNSDHL